MAEKDRSDYIRSPDPSQTPDREALVAQLAKGDSRIKKWLDGLAVSTILTLTPDNVDSVVALFQQPKVAVPPASAIQSPVQPPVPSPPTTSTAVAVTTPTPSVLSPDVIDRLMKLSAQRDRLPSHFVSPPTTFGTVDILTTDEQTKLKSLRKDTASTATLEASLRWLNICAASAPHLSEQALIDHMHTLLPLNCLANLDQLRRKPGCTLREIYSFLQTHHGSSLSRSEIFRSLSKLTSTVGDKDPLTVLQQVSQLLLQVTTDVEDCERAALRDSLSYLKLILGSESYLTLTMFLGEGSFADLFRICKSEFNEVLQARYQERKSEVKKIRKLDVSDQTPTDPIQTSDSITSLSPSSIQDIQHVVHQILGKNNTILTCFSCGDPNHLRRDCPLLSGKNTKSSRPPNPTPARSSGSKKPSTKLPYYQHRCFIHAGPHKNGECFQQLRLPCDYHGGGHAQASCQRLVTDQPETWFPSSRPHHHPSPRFPPQQAPPPQFLRGAPHHYPQGAAPHHYPQGAAPHHYPQGAANWSDRNPPDPSSAPSSQPTPLFPGPTPRVPQPGIHHISGQPAASVPPTTSTTSTSDSFDLDEETKNSLIRALANALHG